MAATLQTMWRVEKITYDGEIYEQRLNRIIKSRETVGVLRTPFEAEVFQFELSGEYVQYRQLKYYMRKYADLYYSKEDWKTLYDKDKFDVFCMAKNEYNRNRSTELLDDQNGDKCIYRIGPIHFTWGS